MFAMPAWQTQPLAIPVRPAPQQPIAQQKPTQWQQTPAVVRGVSAAEKPKFVLPRPEALGVSSSLKLPEQTPQAVAAVDWQAIQTRMQQLNVKGYHKVRVPTGGFRVTLVLPTAPVEAQGDTEAAAILVALHDAEKRGR